MTVELSLPWTAKDLDTGKVGYWTMVYDEGLEIRIEGKKYFAYFKYEFDKVDTRLCISTCSQTVNGYVHNDTLSNWGCWTGHRRGDPQIHKGYPPDDGEEMTKREALEQELKD